MKEALPYLSLAFVIASLVLSLWIASRAGSWRNSDELKLIQAKQVATDARLSEELRKMESHQAGTEARLSVVESQVESEVAHLKGVAQRLESAVARMEGFFMRPPS